MRFNQGFEKYLIAFFSFLCITQICHSQQIGYRVDFFGYADNREFQAPYTNDKTFFGATISPQLYFQLEKGHRIYGGVHLNQEFGTHQENKIKIAPIAYYNYQSQNIDFAIGFLPRYERFKDIPKIVLADTFMYNRPNLEGIYFQYKTVNFSQSIFIDWLSKQSKNKREQFISGIHGRYSIDKFYLKNDGILFHNALNSNDSIEQHIQDNAILTLSAGFDLSKATFLDSLTVDAGVAFGFDRVRSIYEMQKTKGFLSNIYLGYKHFFIHNTLYLGEPMNLPMGDSFYHRNQYDRLEFGWIPFNKGKIQAKLTASFHFSPGEIDNQQQFTLRYNFNNKFSK